MNNTKAEQKNIHIWSNDLCKIVTYAFEVKRTHGHNPFLYITCISIEPILLCRITKSPSFYVYLGPDVMRLGEGRVWSKDLILGFGQGVRSLLVLLKDPYPTVHRELPSSSHLTQKLEKISSNYTHVHPLITAYRTWWYIYANPPSDPPQVHSVAVCFIDIWSINSLTKKFNCDGFT